MHAKRILSLIPLLLALSAPAAAHASTPISPRAVQLAVAFWQPYSSTPVCPGGVIIHQVWQYGTPDSVESNAYTRREDGVLVPNCNVYVAPQFRGMSRPMQCAFVARSLGAAWFGLLPSTDRRNVMYGQAWIVPRACGS